MKYLLAVLVFCFTHVSFAKDKDNDLQTVVFIPQALVCADGDNIKAAEVRLNSTLYAQEYGISLAVNVGGRVYGAVKSPFSISQPTITNVRNWDGYHYVGKVAICVTVKHEDSAQPQSGHSNYKEFR